MYFTHTLGNTRVIPPSVDANTARKPYLKQGNAFRSAGCLKNIHHALMSVKMQQKQSSHSRIQILVLPSTRSELSDDPRVQNQVVDEAQVTLDTKQG